MFALLSTWLPVKGGLPESLSVGGRMRSRSANWLGEGFGLRFENRGKYRSSLSLKITIAVN